MLHGGGKRRAARTPAPEEGQTAPIEGGSPVRCRRSGRSLASFRVSRFSLPRLVSARKLSLSFGPPVLAPSWAPQRNLRGPPRQKLTAASGHLFPHAY